MPCDSIILNRVDLGKLDFKLLGSVLQDMGATSIDVDVKGSYAIFKLKGQWYEVQAGKLVYAEGQPNIADQIKRSYSVATIKQAAKLKGWQVKQVGEFKFQVIKRGFK